MKVRILVFLSVLLLSACNVAEPSPTLPPPPPPLTDGAPPPIVVEGVTVAADERARETAVAESSPTPVETPTLAPTATPIIDNQDEGLVEIVAAGPLPAVNQDLLLIAAGGLKRWGRNGQVQTLIPGGNESASEVPRSTGPIVGDVTGYSLSADGRRAAVVRLTASTEISNTITAVTDTIQTYELSYLNLETNSSRVLASVISGPGQPFFQLSPDGRHVAFSGQVLGAANALTLGEVVSGELFVVETETGIPPKKVGNCAGICQNPVWHQDNNFFVFGDGLGLQLYNLAASKPELLVSATEGGSFPRWFGPLSWARNGRWLLMWVGTGIEGAEQAIFDAPSGQVMVIPHSFFYADPLYAELTWMVDDRLFMVRAETEQGPALGETYRIDPDVGAVQLDETVVLSTEVIHPTAPVHWQNGRFGYGLLAEDWNETVGLYQRVAFNEPAEQVNTLLPAIYAPEIVWATDASGAVIGQGGRLYYAPSGGELYRLDAVGPWAHHFTWLP